MKKYLHILVQTSPYFTDELIDLINNELDLSKYNTFVTHEKCILNLNTKNNIYYNQNMVDAINEEFENYDYIFIHAMNFSFFELLKIKKEARKKFIWLLWGHDIYGYHRKKLRFLYKQLKLRLRIMLLRNIYGFGYGFEYDQKQAYKLLPSKVKAYHLPYGYEKNFKQCYDRYCNIEKNDDKINVLIGHCGYDFINHIEIMKKLKKINNENIVINLVLSYGGSKKYIEKVKKYANDNFAKTNIVIIDELMSDKEYLKFLSGIDIAIFDYKHSAGLANIYKLLYLGKKLYLNKYGILYKGINEYQDIPVFKTQDICCSYDEFSRLLNEQEKNNCYEYARKHISGEVILELWKEFFYNNN